MLLTIRKRKIDRAAAVVANVIDAVDTSIRANLQCCSGKATGTLDHDCKI